MKLKSINKFYYSNNFIDYEYFTLSHSLYDNCGFYCIQNKQENIALVQDFFFFFNMKRATGILTPNNYIPYKYKFKVNFLSVQSMFVSFISNYKFSDILY